MGGSTRKSIRGITFGADSLQVEIVRRDNKGAVATVINGRRERLKPCLPLGGCGEKGRNFGDVSGHKSHTLEHIYQCCGKIFNFLKEKTDI